MDRILIFGNSGSGKTWLSKELSKITGTRNISLDDVFWLPGGYNRKRTDEEVSKEIEKINQQKTWITEGVFGALLSNVIGDADTVIFLDMNWNVCRKNLLQRGSESSRQLNKVVAEENFAALLIWASEYGVRESRSSHSFHNHLYCEFPHSKYRLREPQHVTEFLNQLRSNKNFQPTALMNVNV